MPKALEKALMKVASKHMMGKKKKAKFVYGTMTNMQKEGKIKPWRSLKKGPSK